MKLFLFFSFLFFTNASIADTVDNYQVYVNKILIKTEKGFSRNSTNKDFIDVKMNDTLEINFSHYTAGTSKREIVLFSPDGKVYGEWKFPGKQYRKFMQIVGEDLCRTMAAKTGELCELRYFDEQAIKGVSLAQIRIVSKGTRNTHF